MIRKLSAILTVLITKIYFATASELFVYPSVFNNSTRDEFEIGTFPDDFSFGAATSAYQIEGAWNVNGKGVNIWDTFTHNPKSHVHKGETGDVADDSYYLWDRDIEILKELGVKFYRYSFSWARILPKGKISSHMTNTLLEDPNINWDGIQFYNDTINKLVRAGIEPMITLYHWDLPQTLQDEGGQIDDQFPDWFASYADLCFQLFGDRVKNWITVNEPQSVANCYEYTNCAPGILMTGVGGYLVVHYHLLAHQKAWHLYNDKYRSVQNGKVGLSIVATWCDSGSNLQADVEAAERRMEFNMGWLLSPLLGSGNYPQVMIDNIEKRSFEQGFNKSRLPTFSEEDQTLLLGSTDFVGLNYYTSDVCRAANYSTRKHPTMNNDQDVIMYKPLSWPASASLWLKVVPYGIRRMLNWVQNKYNTFKTPWYITENGYSSFPSICNETMDVNKTQYIVAHVNEIYKAIEHDGINVKNYILWSIIDNFEWIDGYSKKFGVFCVNFDDPNYTRSARYSAHVFSSIIQNRGFQNETLIQTLIANGVISVAS